MILHIHSDVSYISVSHARTCLGGLFFYGDKPTKEDNLNGPILNVASVIKNMVASAAESELGACFQNAHSESHTLNWATHNQIHLYAHIIT
jgi:hypothetical protein